MRPFVLAAGTLAVAFAMAGKATAHALVAVVNPAVDPIRVEAGYDDDTPAEGAKVTVAAADGTVVASGTLDERGLWYFPKPGPGTYVIVVEITGHRTVVRLEVPAEAEPVVYAPWRLDPRLGIAIGLALLGGGVVVFLLLRPKRTPSPVG